MRRSKTSLPDNSLFAHPPWQDPPPGPAGGIVFRLGLRPFETAEWLATPATTEDLHRKRALYAQRYDDVVAGSLTCSAQLVLAQAMRHLPEVGDDYPHLIANLGLRVPEDLCLMQLQENEYRLVAASLCAPSYWRLHDKFGGSLAQIHSAQPGLNSRIGARVHSFFERLPLDRAFVRRNWFLHLSDALFQPDAESQQPVVDADQLYVRSERQTLRRLDAQTVVFTIEVTTAPLREIRHYPAAAATLAQTIRQMSPTERLSFGYARQGEVVLGYLDQLSR